MTGYKTPAYTGSTPAPALVSVPAAPSPWVPSPHMAATQRLAPQAGVRGPQTWVLGRGQVSGHPAVSASGRPSYRRRGDFWVKGCALQWLGTREQVRGHRQHTVCLWRQVHGGPGDTRSVPRLRPLGDGPVRPRQAPPPEAETPAPAPTHICSPPWAPSPSPRL